MPRLQVLDRVRAAEVEGVLAKADVAPRSRCCNGSFSAIATERPCPSAAVVHRLRSAQRSHTSASHSPTEPNAMRCTCPVGQAIVRLRRLRVNADWGHSMPVCDRHGLQTIVPRLASSASTSVLLMYPRSISRWSTSRPCRAISLVSAGVASSSGRFAGVMAQARIRPRSTSAARQRTRIDRHAQGLRQRPGIARRRGLRQFDGAFAQAAIQVGGDQPFANRLQRPLRKRRRLGPQAPQDQHRGRTRGERRCPTLDRHLHASSGRRPAHASDHTAHPRRHRKN